MIRNVKQYLNTAAGIKKGIKQQSWMGFGMLHLANNRRASLYWFLAFVVFLLLTVYAGVEDFPGGVEKPLGVRLFDFISRLAEVLLEIAHGVVATGNGWVVQLVSGVLGCAVRIGRAFLIGQYVPQSEVRSSRDFFNAIGPGVAQGIKWVFAMMAQPWRAIPLCGKGEPFNGLENVGEGLSQHERRLLLAVVQTSKQSHISIEGLGLLTD